MAATQVHVRGEFCSRLMGDEDAAAEHYEESSGLLAAVKDKDDEVRCHLPAGSQFSLLQSSYSVSVVWAASLIGWASSLFDTSLCSPSSSSKRRASYFGLFCKQGTL